MIGRILQENEPKSAIEAIKTIKKMTKIYAIRNDGFGYQSLDLTLLDIARFAPENLNPDQVMDFSRQNSRLAGWW
ncbi:hypothetical protein [Microbulbifer taiwanensis]|uniref:Uncharacterized protein n=1 Tax=Microbulbifer taiwanensis TaxID=986746 RepID=A0ABW1YKL8_9GAMM